MSSMNENSGVIRLDTLDQTDYWVDQHGNQHALTDMTQGYLENVLGHLRGGAVGLYSLELIRQEDLLLIAELTGWDSGRDPSVLPRDPAAAKHWLENTPLVKAITALLGHS
jgi:hypothetical protein